MKIIAMRNASSEGAEFVFSEKFRLHPYVEGGLELDKWWMSWDRFIDFFNEIADKAKGNP